VASPRRFSRASTARYSHRGDDAALAEQIMAYVRDRALVAVQSAGALAAAARYSPDRIAAAYGAVFEGLVGKPAGEALLQPREARP
jgi:hypothetical protein